MGKNRTYTHGDLLAAAQVGYSRALSDKKRGPRPASGDVVVLADWLAERVGSVSQPQKLTLEQWFAGRSGMPCITNPEESCIGRGLCLQREKEA